MRMINIMGIRSKVILNRYAHNYLIMEAITEEQEAEIDARADIDEMYFITENNIKIPARDIFLYGEIDINNKQDLNLINKADIITLEINNAANIPSNFEYETGMVYSDNENIYRCHDTWDKIKWFKFNHCLLGKPNRVIIYRINKQYVSRNRSTRRNYNNAI